MTLLERCRGCHAGAGAWKEILRMDPMPLAGVFCRSLEEAHEAARYPLTWIQCQHCHLVQVLEDVSDVLLYRNYSYASSAVPGLVRHFEQYASFLSQRFGRGPIRVLEIGCNDGVLLRRLPSAWGRVGVDPSDIARHASTVEYELLNLPFSSQLAEQLPGRGEYDLVTSSNSLAHSSDLRDIFRGVHIALRLGGEFLIEVHDLDAALRSGQWDTIYHEHKVEWSQQSLENCVLPLGFEVLFAERLPLHGGLLRAGFRKAARPAARSSGPLVPAPFRRLVSAYTERRQTVLYQTLRARSDAGGTLSAYGASGRANVWLNQLPELPFRFVVDESPVRVNTWLPGVAIPVVPSSHLRDHGTDVCVITAWNYAADIRRKHADFVGDWLQTFTEA